MGRQVKNLVGQRFGLLTVVDYAPRGRKNAIRWRCKCDCGLDVLVLASNLRTGNTESCGCTKRSGPPDNPVRRDFDYDPQTGKLSSARVERKTLNGYSLLVGAGYDDYEHDLVWRWHYGKPGVRLAHRNRDRSDNRLENLYERWGSG